MIRYALQNQRLAPLPFVDYMIQRIGLEGHARPARVPPIHVAPSRTPKRSGEWINARSITKAISEEIARECQKQFEN